MRFGRRAVAMLPALVIGLVPSLASGERPIDVVSAIGSLSGGLTGQRSPGTYASQIQFTVRQWPGASTTAYVSGVSVLARADCGDYVAPLAFQVGGELPIGPTGLVHGTLRSRAVTLTLTGRVTSTFPATGTARMVETATGCDTGDLSWSARPPLNIGGPPPPVTSVPRVVGMTLRAAERRLRRLGLFTATAGTHRYQPATIPDGYADHAVLVPASGGRIVLGQDPSPGPHAGNGPRVTLTTMPAPGRSNALFQEAITTANAAPGRRITIHFRDLPARCHPLDHLDVTDRADYLIAVVWVVEGDSPRCDRLTAIPRTATLPPLTLRGRPILDRAPTFGSRRLIAPAPEPWTRGYLSPGGRWAVIAYSAGSCTELSHVTATVQRGVARVTLYEGATQTFLPCTTLGLSQETFIRLPKPATRLRDGATSHTRTAEGAGSPGRERRAVTTSVLAAPASSSIVAWGGGCVTFARMVALA